MGADTKMDLFLKQKTCVFTCNKCNGVAISAQETFTALDEEYKKFKVLHANCRWEP
jgi:hypothetical protein